MVMDHLYVHVVTVKRVIRTDDGQGGWVEAFAPIGTVTGRLTEISRRKRQAQIIAGQEKVLASHVFYCPNESDILAGDQLVYGSVTVDVIAVGNPDFADHHLEVEGVATKNA